MERSFKTRCEEMSRSLRAELGLDPVTYLPAEQLRGRGDRLQQGTWVHPRVAINLGQWISPAFDVKVSRWVTDWMMGRDVPGTFMPENVRRFLKNRAKIIPFSL